MENLLNRYDRMWHENGKGGQVTPRNLGHEKALDVRSILLVNGYVYGTNLNIFLGYVYGTDLNIFLGYVS